MLNCLIVIVKCLNSSNSIVRSIARHDVYLSPIGQNAPYSAALLRTLLSKLASVNKKLAWTIVNNVVLSDSDVVNMNMILELCTLKINNEVWRKLTSGNFNICKSLK